MFQRRRRRRGIVLLIVLSILALFMVLMVTFVITAGNYRGDAEAIGGFRRKNPSWHADANATVLQLLRDTTERSAIKDHGLLTDFFGNDGLKGKIVKGYWSPSTKGQWLVVDFTTNTANPWNVVQPFGRTLNASNDYYAGAHVTFLSGQSKYKTFRIVKYLHGPNVGLSALEGRLFIESSSETSHEALSWYDQNNNGDWSEPGDIGPYGLADDILISGQPLNGAGHGYLTTAHSITQLQPDIQTFIASNSTFGNPNHALTALFPNHAAYRAGTVDPTLGGADEDWDIADYQNMFLAFVPANPAAAGSYIIPSFHRPELIHYWMNYANGTPWANSLDFRRMIISRPMYWDHPNFTGSNPRLAATDPDRDLHLRGMRRDPLDPQVPPQPPSLPPIAANFWDVDNDSDGIADSVWIDIGLPARTASDGRLYKPLVAVLLKDLDSRLNLNAQGSQFALPANFQASPAGAFTYHPGQDGKWGIAGIDDNGNMAIDEPAEAGMGMGNDDIAIATATNHVVRGLGIGPAEILLDPVFYDRSNSTFQPNELANILTQRSLGDVLGPPTQPSTVPNGTTPGMYANQDDPFSIIENHQSPNQYFNLGQPRTSYSSPPDARGLGAVALDHAGHPVTVYRGVPNENQDDPYEANQDVTMAGTQNAADQLFTIGDLEALLRSYDTDKSQLPTRLSKLAPNTFKSGINCQLVTTHSSHVPSPRLAVPPEARSTVNMTSARLLDLFRTKLINGGVAPASVQAQLDLMFAMDLRKGQLFDINRPFGNGRDDQVAPGVANGVVDDPYESSVGEYAWTDPALNAPNSPWLQYYQTAAFSYGNNDPRVQNWMQNYRQIYARHLYCLMMFLVDGSFNHPLNGGTSATTAQTAQRIAQWAVNVVDFRDGDAIMTPFEYDTNPFDGWSVDGFIGIGPGPDNMLGNGDDVNDATGAQRGLVWGCEYPDLLLTETVAFHNRGVKDTDYDDGQSSAAGTEGAQRKRTDMDPNTDTDLDQFRKPQGSLFLELYATRNTAVNNPVLPAELYDVATGQLDLGRLAPQRMIGGNATRSPVWRVMTINDRSLDADQKSQRNRLYPIVDPNTTTATLTQQQKDDLKAADLDSVLPYADPAARIVWFTPYVPTNDPQKDQIFYERTGTMNAAGNAILQQTSNVLLAPNRYVVVGPRANTPVGSAKLGSDGMASTYDPATQELNIAGAMFSCANTDSATVGPIQTALGIICAADSPSTWTNATQIGLNVSEPLPNSGQYYKEPNITNDPTLKPSDAYADLTKPYLYTPAVPATHNALPDEPFDIKNDEFKDPVSGAINVQTGTHLDFRTAYLQRLADPTLPWNPDPTTDVLGVYDRSLPVNPYITVDWSTVDLTMFSGDEDVNRQVDPTGMGPMEWIDPDDEDPFGAAAPNELFGTRQRGRPNASPPPTSVRRNLWSPVAGDPLASTTPGLANSDNYFSLVLRNDLGYLNKSYGDPKSPAVSGYVGVPATPFPWLVWHDRPFANPLELVLVPASSPSRLCYEFGSPSLSPPSGSTTESGLTETPFNENPTADAYGCNNAMEFRSQFPHLLNFFESGDLTSTGTAGNFIRILDFVETQSPFTGTRTWYDPIVFATAADAGGFRPPFNNLSRFRDPGRLNINTIFDQQIVQGLFRNFPSWDPANDVTMMNKLEASRRGYLVDKSAGSTNFWNKVDMDVRYPSRFSNPFRSSLTADLMPNLALSSAFDGADMRKKGSDATLLRKDPSISAAPFQPMFASIPGTAPIGTPPNFSDPDRSAFFRYQGMMRLKNLVSTNSNVFGIWVTIGYFELEPNGTPMVVDYGHPDGYRLGQEIGSDTGDIKRHRAFYIVDRSIPVGFEPGVDHNVERTILLRRYLD